MNPHLDEDAEAFAAVVRRALAEAGGVDLARKTEADPTRRATEIAPLLDRLGVADIDAAADPGSAEAAAALCREAGRVVLPYPVVATVLGRLALGDRPDRATVDHGDLFEDWRLAGLDATATRGSSDGARLGTRLGPFVGGVSRGAPTEVAPREVALHLTLTGFVIGGALTAALELATRHVIERVQFDKPLSAFQAVQFQLADAHVLVASVEELTQFALWRCHAAPSDALADALAARLGALDAARAVLRTTQQLHGASGVCDEYDISVIVRHLQPALRLPFGAESTAEHLARAIERHGFAGLFVHGGTSS